MSDTPERERMRDRATTHSSECWKWHHACAAARIRELEAQIAAIERRTILRCADACEQRGAEFRGEEQFAEAFGCDDCAAMFRQEVMFGKEER